MKDMPHHAADAIELEAPGQVKAVHAREREAVVASFDEESGYYVSYIELVGGEDNPAEITTRLKWQERFHDNGLQAGIRFCELQEKLPSESEAEEEMRRKRDPEQIPRWTEVEDFLFS